MALEGSMGGAVVALAYFALFQLCGAAMARVFLPEESGGVKLLVGSVLGNAALQWFPVCFAFFLDFSPAAHLCAASLAAGFTGLSLYLGRKSPWFGGKDLFRAFLRRKFLWVVALLLGFYCFLVWKSFLFRDGKIFCSQATYGDMSMHLSFITSLARQGEFPPNYSLLPGVRLSYPFLGDSISASLYLLGAPLNFSYALPMWAAGSQVFFGFYLFASKLLGEKGKAAFAWLLFFGNGGFGFLYFLGDGWENFTRIFTAFYQTPTNLTEENIRWVNVIADMLLPQRATLFGWAVLFSVLFLLYRAVFQGKTAYFWVAGVLTGALPMIHTHSFLALALVCGAWLVFSFLRRFSWEGWGAAMCKALVVSFIPLMCLLQPFLRERGLTDSPWLLRFACMVLGACALLACFLVCWGIRAGRGKTLLKTWGAFLGIVCLLALPQLFTWTFRQASNGSFVRGHFGWVVGEDGYLLFYLKNLGLGGILGFLGLVFSNRKDFFKYAPVLPIWFLAEFVEFQPNDYDNNKLLYVAYAFLCCAGAEYLVHCLKRLGDRRVRAGAAAAVTACSMCSAVLTWGREAVAEYELYGEGALDICQYAEENIPPSAVVLTDMRHNNEIAALAGRNVVCGSSSYLYFHGLPYHKNEDAVRKMYEAPLENRRMFEEFQVDYILVSSFERSSYQVDEKGISSLFPKVYEKWDKQLYRVTKQEDRP